MTARDFGVVDDPFQAAEEDVRPYLGLSARDRLVRFFDLIAALERIWQAMEPERRLQADRARLELDDPGRWWERVPHS